MSTSRSMMTTARSDVATGRYNDIADPEKTETRIFEMRGLADSLEDDAARRRAGGAGAGRTGKTPRAQKTAASTAAGLRAGLLRRGAQLRGRSSTGRTPRTARMEQRHNQQQRLPGVRPSHGG
jgi:hypothetical protein